MNRPRAIVRGFTLLELMVAIVVLGTVTTIGTRAFFGLTSAWQDTRKLAALDHFAEVIFASLRRDLDSAIASDLTGLKLRGYYENRPEDQRYWDQELAADRIIVPVEAPADLAGGVEPRMVMYSVDPAADALIRSQGLLSDADAPKDARESIVRGTRVLRFRAEYLDSKGQWQREWLDRQWIDGNMPRAVRISITLADEFRREIQVARKEVFALRVR